MLLLPFTILFNVVILAIKAQQLPPLSQTQPPKSLPIINSMQSPTEPQMPPQVPTKPPLVQLTRITVAQPELAASTANFIPSPTSIITIDVSQPPMPVTPAPQLSQNKPNVQEMLLEQISSNPMPMQRLVNITQPQEFPTSTSSQSSISNNATYTTTPLPLDTSTSLPVLLTNLAQPLRDQESKRLIDVPVIVSVPIPAPTPAPVPIPVSVPALTSASITPPNANVQFLKPPRSKFKCLQSSACENGGMCFNGTCFCQPGFTGESCSLNINECRQVVEPCLNNGICIDEVNQYRCECTAGFRGDRCQDSVDMCVGSPCLNDAKCINHRTDYSCECEPGWEGRHCEKNIDECLRNPCHNNGTCYDLVNDYRCDCGSSGFTGKNCDVDFDDCTAKPCGLGAKECIDLTADFRCVCYDGFTGKKCEVDIDECETNPCENNGTCIEKSLNVHHLHNLTIDLTIYHEIRDQNLSSSMNMSQYAGYTCECKEDYYGDRCEEKKKCATKSASELCNHKQAECVNVGSSYECLIAASFDGSGRNYANYRVNGEFKMREIYVKYKSLTGGIIMSFETTQLDSPIADLQLNKSGLYLSGAPIKRDENIKFDELLDGGEREIRLGLDTPTEIKSITLTRQNTINDYHAPFKGCLMQVRLNNQLVPLVDYDFGMNHSFELAESHLELGQCHTCFDKDCLNHGRCESQEGYEHCACSDAFTGTFCEIDVNECEKNFGLCSNGGICENLHGGHRCNCKEGFRGENCQDISDYCKAKQPCVTGTCKNVTPAQGTYQCECPSSHIGKRCDRKRDCLNECHSHHAQCINNVTCACLPGRREERIMCEYVASCEQVEGELCLNGGTCKNLEIGGYHCECQEPFYGPICQFLVEKPQFDVILLIVVTCIGFLMAACAVVSLVIFRSVRKARATRGTYSPSTQEKFGNSASDLLKPPQPERLI